MKIAQLTLTLAFLAAVTAPALADNEVIIVPQQQGSVVYLSGGVGEDEMDAMKAEAGDYNLQITNTDRTGHFVDGAHITILDRNNNILVDAPYAGPLFYANLAPGVYTINASNNGQTYHDQVRIGRGHSTLVLTWRTL